MTLLTTVFIYACAPTVEVESAPASLASSYLTIEYSDAASVRNQLAFGTLKQAVLSLSGDTTTATEELTAVQDQITAAMTEAQLQAIAGMQITNAGLNVFYAEYGILLPTPIPGVTKVPGSSSGKTEEEKAASQATAAASGQTTGTGLAARAYLFEKVIELLTEVSRR